VGASTLIACGQRIPPLARVARVGALLGIEQRSTAYRMADRDAWPMTGDKPNQYVVVPALLDRLGVPYTYEADTADDGSDS
jgi:hypothetical protein